VRSVEMKDIAVPGRLDAVGFSRDTRWFVTVTTRLDSILSRISLWETETGKEIRRWNCGMQTHTANVSFCSDCKHVAICADGARVMIWDTSSLLGWNRVRTTEMSDLSSRSLWDGLSHTNPAIAHGAIWRLVSMQGAGVRVIAGQLRPAKPTLRTLLLIPKLNDEKFFVREQASKDLAQIGESAEPLLNRHLGSALCTLEQRKRIERLLENLKSRRLAILRSLTVLEYIGTVEAERFVRTLTEGDLSVFVTKEALVVHKRMCSRERAVNRLNPP
jgi:hypothetical protein